MKTKLHYVFSITLFFMAFSMFSQGTYWKQSDKTTQSEFLRHLDDENYTIFDLDMEEFKQELIGTPLRGQFSGRSNTILEFPNDKGSLEKFRIIEVPTLSHELSLQFPELKTYLGFGIDSPGARVRFSVTPRGLKTMTTYVDRPMIFSQPLIPDEISRNIVYNRNADTSREKSFNCLTDDVPNIITGRTTSRDANDQMLRTYRMAISTTGEYTNSVEGGGSQASALSAVVATLNRTNEVFEVDMAITFNLISGTEIIYDDAGTDPYIGGSLNSELQTTLTAEIGEANYDIGHLFAFSSTIPGNGNAGCIGCVCQDGSKGSGFSSHPFLDNDGGPYMSDFFDIDYVPHEIGHQMGANHTWSFGSEGTGVNYEPASGTTIMGYAGITGPDDVQDHSDPYFHYASIDQILTNVASAPNDCATLTAITNNPPVADAGADYSIPQGTAFKLTGAATDPDVTDELTYTWEQIDDGVTTSTNFGPTKATGALWRSRPPSTNPERYMPIFSRVLAGQLTETNPVETVDNSSWETVSTVARDLNFALTVRDRSEADGIGQSPQSDFDDMTVSVIGTPTPFSVTYPLGNGVGWLDGTQETITWDVAGTTTGDGNGIDTDLVNIWLSTDGGMTFPTALAMNTANDGSHLITVPNVVSTTCRIMIEAVGNIFYTINTSEFAIGYDVTTTCMQYSSSPGLAITDDGGTFTETDGISVPDVLTIDDINISIDISHTWTGDLLIAVLSPDGTQVNLMTPGDCGDDDDVNVTFDDEGVPFDCTNAGAGQIYQSLQDPLSNFHGETSMGTWTIGLGDFAAGDTGTLNSWTVEICSTEFTLATPTADGFGNFKVYPNPNNGEFTVQLSSSSNNDLTMGLFDLRGRKILDKRYPSSTQFSQTLRLNDLQSGVYLLKVSDGARSANKKIIIE